MSGRGGERDECEVGGFGGDGAGGGEEEGMGLGGEKSFHLYCFDLLSFATAFLCMHVCVSEEAMGVYLEVLTLQFLIGYLFDT